MTRLLGDVMEKVGIRLFDHVICGADGTYSFAIESANVSVKANILLFSRGDDYYEIRTGGEVCLRKYLLYRQSRA